MAAANIVSSLFSIILFIYLARVLLPEGLGYLSYAFTIVFFLSNIIDFGLSTYGSREIAKDTARASSYVSEIVSFRLIAASLLTVLLVVVTFLSRESRIMKIIMLESSFMLFTFALGTEWAFRGMEKMNMTFYSFAATSVLQIGLIYLFVKGPSDLLNVPLFYFVGTLPVAVVFLRRLKFEVRITIEDLKRIFKYLSSSLVIWAISLFAQVYNSLDVFMLGLFRTIGEVGYFTIARRVISSGALLMIFMANALLPHLSFTFTKDITQFRASLNKFLKFAVILTVCVLLPAIFLSKELILAAFGRAYLSAAVPLSVMIIGLVLILFNLPYSTALIAVGLEKEVLKQVAASALLSIAANLVLIPRYGMIGASISFVMAEALALVWIVWVYEKKLAV